MNIEPVAYIYTGFPEKFGIPRQSGLVEGAIGRIVFEAPYRHPDAIRGLEEYDRLWLIWDFSMNHRSGWNATVAPPRLGGKERVGVFASRSPFRPNPIGLSCVKLEYIDEDGSIVVSGVDMLDKTPVYDIKPYLPYADSYPDAKGGFTERTRFHELEVDIPEELCTGISEDILSCIKGLLHQDPRTAYIHDDERIWGISYAGYNIRFTVSGDELKVTEIKDIDEMKKDKLKADAVFLDVDGTLWDSTPLVAEAWTRALKENGLDRQVEPDELKKLFGKPMDVIARELLPDINADIRDKVMEKCIVYEQQILEENTKDISYPAVADTIHALAEKIPVCIVSNCQSGYIELVMRKLCITEDISDKECYGDTGLYKAENIRLVADRRGYKHPVYVGDIQGDQDAAHEAKAAFIHAAYGFGTADAPEAVINTFPELLTILAL